MDTRLSYELKSSLLRQTMASIRNPLLTRVTPAKALPIRFMPSASTLRHSSPAVSFGKAQRFAVAKPNCTQVVTLNIPDTKNKRSTSFGLGQKHHRDQWKHRCSLQSPAPTHYNPSDRLLKGVQSKSISSVPRSAYNKVYQSHRQDVHNQFFSLKHPSFIYNIDQKIGSSKRKYSFGSKLTMFTQLTARSKKHVPGPNYNYSSLKDQSRSQTNSKRLDFSKPANDNPGPIYNVS